MLQVFQMDGKKVLENNLSGENQNKIDLHNFQNGIYIIVIFNENKKAIHKLVIAK